MPVAAVAAVVATVVSLLFSPYSPAWSLAWRCCVWEEIVLTVHEALLDVDIKRIEMLQPSVADANVDAMSCGRVPNAPRGMLPATWPRSMTFLVGQEILKFAGKISPNWSCSAAMTSNAVVASDDRQVLHRSDEHRRQSPVSCVTCVPLAVLRCGRFEAGCAELELAPQLELKVRLCLRGQLYTWAQGAPMQ